MRRREVHRALLGLLGVLAAWPAAAGLLELRQGSEVGAGTGFRRGEQCHVLTAAHVVREAGLEVTVLDRSGVRAVGQVSYANPAYDVALVTLAPGAAVACTERWPDGDWMAAAGFNSRSEFEARRHYPSGRETLVRLRWAGGTADTLTLARTDKMEIRSSDSGSMVWFGDRLAGIVKEVDTAVDRVEVLRFDVIDRLLGSRFRGGGAGAVAFEGVQHRNRPQPTWSSYVVAWLTESAGRPVVRPDDASARCRLRTEVIDWSQRNVTNPAYAQVQARLAGCRTGLGRGSKTWVQLCEDSARNELKATPRQQRVHALQLQVTVTPTAGAALSRLRTVEMVEQPEAVGSRADAANQVLQSAFSQVAKELLDGGACD